MATSPYTVQVGTITAGPGIANYIIRRGSLRLKDAIGTRGDCRFILTDVTGAQHFTRGTPVTVKDSNGQLVYAGFIDTDKETRETFGGVLSHDITCMDMTWLAKKRIAAKSYTAALAGDIVADLCTNYLVPEGVIGTRTQPTFTRATIATRASDGVDVASGVARFEPGGLASSSALRVEEGATNLLSANQSNFETGTTGAGGGTGVTFTRDTTQHWQGTASGKMVTAAAGDNYVELQGGNILGAVSNVFLVSPSTPYTFSAWLRGDGTAGVTLRIIPITAAGAVISDNFAPGAITATTFTRKVFTLTMPANAAGVLLRIENNTAFGSCWFDGLQWEQRAYATTWQVGGTARNAETLALPAAGAINPAQGTIQWRVLFDATVRRQIAALNQHLLGINNSGATSALKLFHQAASANWTVSVANDTGTTDTANFADSSTPDGWHALAVAWDAASLIAYVDGVAKATINSPHLPSILATSFFLGADGVGANQANTLYQDVRVSSRKRSAAEIASDAALSGFLPLDDSTIYLLPLNATTTATTSIDAGPVVTEAIFNYAHISDCLDKLAEVGGVWWNIDANRLLHFQAPATLSAPQAITGATMEQDTAVSVERSAPLYRNRQYITGGTDLTSTQTETRKGDGTSKAFTLSYPFAKVPTVTVNAVAKTVGIKGVDTGKDWYWAKGDAVLAQDSAGVTLISTDTLQVVYQGEFPLVYVAQDSGQVTANQTTEGGTTTGLVDEVDIVSGTTSSTSAGQYAAAKLARYAQGGIVVTFPTRTAGFKSGQIADVSLASHGLSHVSMLIEEVDAGDNDLDIWYTVKAVAGPVDSTWLDYFKSLSASAVSVDAINLGSGGVLVLSQTVTETWTWTESVTQAVQACLICNTSTLCGTGQLVC